MGETPTPLDRPIAPPLADLASKIQSDVHLLSLGNETISSLALTSAKEIFDLALSLEPLSHPHLHPFLESILQPTEIQLRSAKKATTPVAALPSKKAEDILPFTPLGELTVEGLDNGQVWAQLELRNGPMAEVMREVGPGEVGNDDEEAIIRPEESDSDSEGSMDEEDFRQYCLENGMDPDEFEAMEGSDDSEDSEDYDDEVVWKDEMDSDEEDSDEEDSDEDGDDIELDSEDEEDDNDELDVEISGDDEDDLLDEEEDEEQDGDVTMASTAEEEGDDDVEALFGRAGPSRRPRHPTLDDEFFSIDEFNRLTEEAEAGRLSGGKLGGDEDEDDNEFGDIGELMLRGAEDADTISYKDFFEPPRRTFGAPVGNAGKGKGKGKEGVPLGKGKGKKKGKGVKFDFDEAEEDLKDEIDDDEDYEARGRVKGDLFDDEDEEEQEQDLSNHEKRQLALAKQIAELESKAIGPKEWTLLGEASSKSRPENSLLEENLDFEHAGKVVPVITEETVKTLEEMIKARIIDNNFDSPVRVRAYEPTPFLPSRYFELQDTQSSKSLAQIYEEEYQSATTGTKIKDPRDEKLKKEHEEIEKVWGDICYKLDALSSLNFVPKAPKASITTISNLPTTSMESALPPTAAANTMLAPEEMFQPPTAVSLVSRSELTPEEKQQARARARKGKAATQKRLGDMADLYGKKKKGAKAQKEEALKGLVKSGKGVTVVGKGDKERSKVAKRGAEGDREDSKRLKL